MDLRRMRERKSLPEAALITVFTEMEERLGAVEFEITVTQGKLDNERSRLKRRRAKLDKILQTFEAARVAWVQAEEDRVDEFDRRPVNAKEALDRAEAVASNPRHMYDVEITEGKIIDLEAQLEQLMVEKIALEEQIAGKDVEVAFRKASDALQAHRESLFDSIAASEHFDDEMGPDSLELHTKNEQARRIKARVSHLTSKLRAYVQGNPQGLYRTENDLYPARVFAFKREEDGVFVRVLVFIQRQVFYFYPREAVEELLGHEVPKYLLVNRVEFEKAVRNEDVETRYGKIITIDEILPLLKTTYGTPAVKVKVLGPDEQPEMDFLPVLTGGEPIAQLNEELAEELSGLMNDLNEDLKEEHQVPKPTRLRQILNIPKRMLEGAIGEMRTESLYNRIFGRK